uniref:Centrosomal protein 170Aa n=1 Tax=Petromyzon marinus TaxID=7757 RepID=S4R6H2_PETMA
MSETWWFLVGAGGTRHRLPRELIFAGREDCELVLHSRSVDKQHAVINYDLVHDQHMLKDLGSLNGTFVNEVPVPDQTYVSLKQSDVIRFGYDPNVYTVEKGEHKVPEEALRYKYMSIFYQISNQITEKKYLTQNRYEHIVSSQMSVALSNKVEVEMENIKALKLLSKALGLSNMPRGTPLYGRPSWWGESDGEWKGLGATDSSLHRDKHKTFNGADGASEEEAQKSGVGSLYMEGANGYAGLRREPSYFEIPTKELQREGSEPPTRDTDCTANASPGPAQQGTPPAQRQGVPGHGAAFTIEFFFNEDDGNPRKRRSNSFSPGSAPEAADGGPLTALRGKVGRAERPSASPRETEPRGKPPATSNGERRSREGSPHTGETRLLSEKTISHCPCSDAAAHANVHTMRLYLLDQIVCAIGSHELATVYGVSVNVSSSLPHTDKDGKTKADGITAASAALGWKDGKPELEWQSGLQARPVGPVAPSASQYRSQWASLATTPSRRKSDETLYSCEAPQSLQADADGGESCVSVRSSASDGTSSQSDRRRRALPQIPLERTHSDGIPTTAVGPFLARPSTGTGAVEEKEGARVVAADGLASQDSQTVAERAACGGNIWEIDVTCTSVKESASLGLRTLSAKTTGMQRSDAGDIKGGPRQPSQSDSGFSTPKTSYHKAGDEQRDSAGSRQQSTKSDTRPESEGGLSTRPFGDKPLKAIGLLNSSLQDEVLGRPRSASESRPTRPSDVQKKSSGKALVRQGSFTKERPSSLVPIEMLPHISTVAPAESHAGHRERSNGGETRKRNDSGNTASSTDTSLLLKETEAAVAALEAKLSVSGGWEGLGSPIRSPSPESDVDTSSTVSLVNGEGQRKAVTQRKASANAREKLSELRKARSVDPGAKADVVLGSRRTRPGVDNMPRGGFVPTPPSSKPRPTRTSLMRRARLGDVSDNESGDVDRASVISDVSTTSSTGARPSPQPGPRRSLSRIDLLAQPRRPRVSSSRSDTEATVMSPASGRSSLGSRIAEAGRGNLAAARLSGAAHGTPGAMARSRTCSESRDREPRSRSSSSTHSSPSGIATVLVVRGGGAAHTGAGKPQAKGGDEDYLRHWTVHSEEIARISKDLAKDLAILAREIHSVTGDPDGVSSSGTAPSTTGSTAPPTPGSSIDAREEEMWRCYHVSRYQLVPRIFDESLNFKKVPLPERPCADSNDGTGGQRLSEVKDPFTPITRKRTWSRDEVVLDTLMLTSIAQLSQRIRSATDKTTSKIRYLFKDQDLPWEAIESKLSFDGEVPLLRTTSRELTSILQDLRKVEKQLQ